MPATEIHQFAYGLWNPVAAFVLAFAGSLIVIGATGRARAAGSTGRRVYWLVLASVFLGGSIWLMHFVAMLGFDVPASPIRYNVVLTAGSALVAVLVVGIGLFAVGTGRRSPVKLILGGVFTGSGIAVMHYTGMAAIQLSGTIGYDPALMAASVLIAIAAATVALWFSLVLKGRLSSLFGALIMAVAVTVMHYTGMAALHVHLTDGAQHPVTGAPPLLLVSPIVVVALIGLIIAAAQSITSPATAAAVGAPGEGAGATTPGTSPEQPDGPKPVSLADFSAMQSRTNRPR
jgi:NO-binding membrane sensor protein with MHYT domain